MRLPSESSAPVELPYPCRTVTVTPARRSTPWLRCATAASFDGSPPSAPTRGAGPRSATVTSRPRSRQAEAISEPVKPPPITSTRCGPAASRWASPPASLRVRRVNTPSRAASCGVGPGPRPGARGDQQPVVVTGRPPAAPASRAGPRRWHVRPAASRRPGPGASAARWCPSPRRTGRDHAEHPAEARARGRLCPWSAYMDLPTLSALRAARPPAGRTGPGPALASRTLIAAWGRRPARPTAGLPQAQRLGRRPGRHHRR